VEEEEGDQQQVGLLYNFPPVRRGLLFGVVDREGLSAVFYRIY
jgi:hypothetical protein